MNPTHFFVLIYLEWIVFLCVLFCFVLFVCGISLTNTTKPFLLTIGWFLYELNAHLTPYTLHTPKKILQNL